MCRGREAKPSHGDSLRPRCEICNSPASLYCQADDAFLCRKCDKWVHGANFLAQRHIRCLLCDTCQGLTQRYLIRTALEVVLPTIASRGARSRWELEENEKRSRTMKRPFLFL
ncbi:hypothetical protein NMG60_11035472 [Bertholletia excelsa]